MTAQDLRQDLVGFFHSALVYEISERIIEFRLYFLPDFFDSCNHVVPKIGMEPAFEALVARKNHERERTARNIRLRKESGNIPHAPLYRFVVPHTDIGPSRMLNAF